MILRVYIQATVNGNQIPLTVPSEHLSNYRPVIAVVRYLPLMYDIERVGAGFGSCIGSYHLLEEELLGRSMPVPPFPGNVSDAEDCTREYDDPHRFSIPPSRRRRPINPPDVVPLTQNWPRPGDIDNDGDNDHDLGVDMPVVGLIIVDVWITDDGDGSAYVIDRYWKGY